MKAFGIEIRKTGTVHELYKDVDTVLKKASLLQSKTSFELQRQTLAHSLQRMMAADKYFDVCTIRSGIDLCQIIIPIERMRVYQSIHCVSWNQMLPEYRELIIAMIFDDFRSVLNPDAQ